MAYGTYEHTIYKNNVEKKQMADVVVDRRNSRPAFAAREVQLNTFAQSHEPPGDNADSVSELQMHPSLASVCLSNWYDGQ